MRKKWKRALSMIVSLCLVLGMVPMSAFAQTTEESEDDGAAIVETVSGQESATEEVTEEPVMDVSGQESAEEEVTEETATDVSGQEPATEELTGESATDASTEAKVEEETEVAVDEKSTEQSMDKEEPKAETQTGEKDSVDSDKTEQAPARVSKAPARVSKAPSLAPQAPASDSDIQEMTLNSSYSVSVEAGGYWVGSFTAAVAGTYDFYSEGSDDTYGALYSDADLENAWTSDDQGGTGDNFRIRYELSANQTVYLKVKEYYSGALNCTVFVVDPTASLANAYISMSAYDIRYTGNPVEFNAVVYGYYGSALTEGTDFEFVFKKQNDETAEETTSVPSEIGDYYVYARALGDHYTGTTANASFTIFDGHDLAWGDFWLNASNYEITGEPVALKASVYDYDSNALTEGEDFVFVYVDEDGQELTAVPSEPGNYGVFARGTGTYNGVTPKRSFTIFDSKDLAKAHLYVNTYYVPGYGSPVNVDITVSDYYYNDLTEGTDYELVYVDEDKNESSTAPSKPGYYLVYAVAKGNTYTGQTSKGSFYVRDVYDLAYGSLSLSETRYVISGQPVSLDLTVKDFSGKELSKDQDYKLLYYNSDAGYTSDEAPAEAGSYRVYASGTGDYQGTTSSYYFTIYNPYDFTGFSFDDGTSQYSYTGEPVALDELTVSYYDYDTYSTTYLTEGTDYQLTYFRDEDGNRLDTAPSAAGAYYAVYSGMAPYTGTYDRWFRISADESDFSNARLILGQENYDYSGDEVYLYYDVKINGHYVYSSYDIVYYDEEGNELSEKPVQVGTYQAAARAGEGSGSSGETPKVTFYICGTKDIGSSRYSISYNDKVICSGEPVSPPVITRFYDYDSYELVEGTDYEFDHFEDQKGNPQETVTALGSYYAVYKGIGRFTGFKKIAFSVVNSKLFENVKVQVDQYVPLVDGVANPKVTVTDLAGDALTPEEDYRVVFIRDAYAPNNVVVATITEAGSYKAVIRPGTNGEYSGETQEYFTVYDTKNLETVIDYSNYWTCDVSNTNISLESAQLPTVTFYHQEGEDKVTLTENVEYKLDRIVDENTDQECGTECPDHAGEFTAYYSGIAPYSGTRTVYFSIYDTHNLGCRVGYSDYWYGSFTPDNCVASGAAGLPASKIYHGSGNDVIALTEGVEYQLDHISDRYGDENYQKVIPTEAGEYYAHFTGIAPYYGTLSIAFSVFDSYDLNAQVDYSNYWNIRFVPDSIVLAGADALPTVSVYHLDSEENETALTEGTHFELTKITDEKGQNCEKAVPVTAGYYTAYYSGIAPYKGTLEVGFTVYDPYDLSSNSDYGNWEGSFSPNAYILKGATELPSPEIVYYEDYSLSVKLTEGTHFELDRITDAYGDEPTNYEKVIPSEAGEYLAYYKGMAPYKGELSIRFMVIDPADLGTSLNYYSKYWSTGFTPDSIVMLGETELPAPMIYHTDENNEAVILAENENYAFDRIVNSYGATVSTEKTVPDEAGEYTAYYKGVDPYKGEASIPFTVVDPHDLGAKKSYYSYYWTASFTPDYRIPVGTTELPTPMIYCPDEDGISDLVLEEGKDYELEKIVSVNDTNTSLGKDVPAEPGDYYAVYRGKDPYFGVRRISLTVYSITDIGSINWTASFRDGSKVYTNGNAVVLPELLIQSRDGQKLLTEGEDFEFLRFEDYYGEAITAPDDDGQYYAVYKGTGAYEGQRRVMFEVVNSRNFNNATISLAANTYPVTGEPIVPEVTVSDRIGNVLTTDDYELVYYDEERNELSDGAPSAQGVYYVAAKATESGQYHGTTGMTQFTVGEVTYQTLDPVIMTSGVSETVSLKRNEEWVGIFTAPVDDTYIFSSLGTEDTYGVLYEDTDLTEEITHNDDYNGNQNFCIIQKLTANQTVALKAYQYGHRAAGFSVSVTPVDRKDLAIATMKVDNETWEEHGNVYMPAISIVDAEGTVLTEGTHYELQYSLYNSAISSYVQVDDVTKSGKYKVVAKAIAESGYTNQTEGWTFDAYEATDLAVASVEITKTLYAGDDVEAFVTVTDRKGNVLTPGEDYNLLFYQEAGDTIQKLSVAPTEEGSYYVVATEAGSTYTGQTGMYAFDVVHPYDFEVNGGVSLLGYSYMEQGIQGADIPVYTYNDAAVTPGVAVTFNDEELPGDKYTVSYENNTAPTTGGLLATVTVTGLSPYKGSITRPFMIVAKPGIGALIDNNGFKVQTGDAVQTVAAGTTPIRFAAADWAVTPVICIESEDGTKYTQGQDFTVSYRNSVGEDLTKAPVTAGNYQMVLTATSEGKCKGTATVDFSLVNHNLEEKGSLTLSGYSFLDDSGIAIYDYEDEAVIPGVKVQYGNTILNTGDYTISCTNNAAPTVGDAYATVTVTGKAPYEGSLTEKFRIVAKPTITELINANGLVVNDRTFPAGTTKIEFTVGEWAGLTAPEVMITETPGVKYIDGEDFVVSFEDASGTTLKSKPTETGSYKMVLSAITDGRCRGTATLDFELVDPAKPEPVDISKAVITLGSTSYTYDGKVKSPGIKKVTLGDAILIEETDFEVTVPSGRKNVGTYTYTLTGKGNYKGTLKASFKIVKAKSSIKLAAQSKTYTGKKLTYNGKVTKSGSTGKVTYTYYSDAKGKKTVAATKVKDAKVYYVKATLDADKNHKAANSPLVKFTITKAKNTMTVKTANKTVKLTKVKKKAQTLACISAKKAKGAVTYTLTTGVTKKVKKYVKVNANNGKITLIKGTPKGTYTVKVKVAAKGNSNYKALAKTVIFKITVK